MKLSISNDFYVLVESGNFEEENNNVNIQLVEKCMHRLGHVNTKTNKSIESKNLRPTRQ